MPWPRDDAKLERVRALMDAAGLDAIVARAPDNVLYLTNFWGMKGWDTVVFPREGEPTLSCVEASADDAERTAWTNDVRLVDGYLADDPRPPVVRTLERAAALAGEHGTVGLELSLGTQASDRMVGEPTTYTKAWFDAFPGAADATPALAEARKRKTAQEVERMRLANEIAAAAMDHVRGVIRPGTTEAQIAAEWPGFVHGEGTGWAGKVASRSASRSSGPAVGSRPSRRPRTCPWSRASRRCSRSGSSRTATGPTTRRTSSSASTPTRTATETGFRAVYDDAVAFCMPGASLAELDRRIREGIARIGHPGSPPTRYATASALGRTSPRTPPGGGWRGRRGHGACNRARMLLGRAAAACASRTTS